MFKRNQSANVLGTNGSTLLVNSGYTVNDGNGGNNYHVQAQSAPGTIIQAPLQIMADDKTRPVGAPNPPFTARYSGFVSGENANVLTQPVAFATDADASSPPGNHYSIQPYGASAQNYVISYVDGTLVVTAASDPGVPDMNRPPVGLPQGANLPNLSLSPTAAGEDSCKKKGGREDGLVQDNILVQECGILMP